jgi:hypothetical protein
LAAGERLFEAIVTGDHGLVNTDDYYDASWARLPRQRVELHLPELLDAVAALPTGRRRSPIRAARQRLLRRPAWARNWRPCAAGDRAAAARRSPSRSPTPIGTEARLLLHLAWGEVASSIEDGVRSSRPTTRRGLLSQAGDPFAAVFAAAGMIEDMSCGTGSSPSAGGSTVMSRPACGRRFVPQTRSSPAGAGTLASPSWRPTAQCAFRPAWLHEAADRRS